MCEVEVVVDHPDLLRKARDRGYWPDLFKNAWGRGCYPDLLKNS